MRYHRLDLNLLTALKALLTEKNVTRAGESMHVTQSAMSGILARLRSYFDDPMIVHVGRKMELTPLAESLLQPLSDVLLRIDATISTRPAFNPATSTRHFSIVASDYTISVVLAEAIQRIYREAPGITLELRMPSDAAAAELEAGDVDFIIHPQDQGSSSQPGEALFEDSYMILADKDHPHVGETMSIEEYQQYGHVGYKNGSSGLSMYESWFSRTHGDERRMEVYAHSFHLLPHLVTGTDRLATMHTRLAQAFTKQWKLRLIRPLFETPRLIEMLQWHKYRDQDLGNVWVRQCLIDATRNLRNE